MKLGTKFRSIIILSVLCLCAVICGTIFSARTSTRAISVGAVGNEDSSIEEMLTFSPFNGGTEYQVRVRDKQITKVKIPAIYNGYPVTEIADNAFANCTLLTKIDIPYTVKKVGNNAFANCKNLEKILGMPKVESIGNNAFAACVKLDNLILPSTITALLLLRMVNEK